MNLQKLVPLIASGEYKEAYKKLSKIAKRSPHNAEAWFLLSFVYQKQRQQIYSLEKALQADKENKFAARRLAEIKSGAAQLTPITTFYPLDTLKKKGPPAYKAILSLIFVVLIGIGAAAVWFLFLQPAFADQQQSIALTELAGTPTLSESEYLAQRTPEPPVETVEVIIIESTPTLDPAVIEETAIARRNEGTTAEAEAYGTLDARASATAAVYATATAVVQATEQAIADATATAEAEAEAAAAANQGPALDQFINQVRNGNGGQVVGVYFDGIGGLRVVGQPSGNPGWVSESWGTATYFAMVKQYTGNDGLLAHNYLSGGLFFSLYGGQSIYLIYGDGHYRSFSVSSIRDFQALQPYSSTSDFVDLASGATLSTTSAFYAVFGGSLRVTLQTCITRDGNTSWGRRWVIAPEY